MQRNVIKGIICLIVIGLVGCGSEPAEIVVGNKAPVFSLTALDGTNVKSQAYKGQIVVLNFWATWCQNCRKELPGLKALAATTNAKILSVVLDEGGVDTVRPFVKKHAIDYTVRNRSS